MSTVVKTDISLSAIALCIAMYLGSAYSQSLAYSYSWPVTHLTAAHIQTAKQQMTTQLVNRLVAT